MTIEQDQVNRLPIEGQGYDLSSKVLQLNNKAVVGCILMKNTRKAFTEVVIFQFSLLILDGEER